MIRTLYAKDLFLSNEPFNFYFFNSSNVTPHKHSDFYEIFIILNGSANHYFNGKQNLIDKRTFCIVRPGDTHSFSSYNGKTNTQHLNIRIQPVELKKLCFEIDYSVFDYVQNAENTTLTLTKEEFSQVNFWITQLLVLHDKPKQDIVIKMLTRIFLTLFYIKRVEKNSLFPEWFSSLLIEINKQEFIDKSAKDIYALCNYSSNYTINAFKHYLGVTPGEYLLNLKMNYACSLLKNTNYTTLTISNAVGFYSLSYFTNTFKKKFGLTPSEYRNKAITNT